MTVTKPTSEKDIERSWYFFDLKGENLGRTSTKIAKILMGKAKPYFVRHLDCGDFVVIINAEKIKVTGQKATDKIYHFISGYASGVKSLSLNQMLARNPRRIVLDAVRGMLPHNRLGRKQITKCKVFCGPEHKHKAQNPVALEI